MSTVKLVSEMLQDQLVISMEEFAARLDPTDAVLDTLTRQLGGGVSNVGRMEFKWRERRLATISDQVTAAEAVGQTSISVANPTAYHRDQMVFDVAGGDMFYVDEDIGGTAAAGAVKVRGKTGTGGITTALAEGAILLIGPESHAEGEAIPPSFANVETVNTAYVFQMDETIQVSDILKAEESYGVPELMQQRKDKMKEMLERYGLAMYNSVGGRETNSGTNSARRHSMTGLVEYLSTVTDDVASIPGGLTRTTIGQLIRPTTIYGEDASKKVCLPGQNAWESISSFPDSALRAASGESKMWGVTVHKLVTAFGTLNLVYDPLLSEENGMEGDMYVLSKANIKQVQLNGLPLVFKTNVQNSTDIHNQIDVHTGTRGLMLKLPELHRRFKNI